mgnify:FL=1|jgi:hypothetical protein|tara:strand:+ start:5474 stop:5860 length:387 start_codon:yes stop_codon:yes gene_type:complete
MTLQEKKEVRTIVKKVIFALQLKEEKLTPQRLTALINIITPLVKPLVEAHKWNKSNGRDYSKEKDYNSSPKRKKYRAELNKANRDRGDYGNQDGQDLHHASDGTLKKEPSSKNKGRKEKSRKKGYNSK